MTNLQHNAARAGYMLGGALGIVRFAGAETIEDVLLACGLTLAELGAVWFVEKKALRLESDRVTWQAEADARGRADAQVGSAEEEQLRRERLLADTVEELAGIDEACERDHLMSDAKVLHQIALNAVRSGYHDGIVHNAGRLAGVKEGGKAA